MLKATFNFFVLEIYVTDNNTRKELNLRTWLRIIAYLPRWYTLFCSSMSEWTIADYKVYGPYT